LLTYATPRRERKEEEVREQALPNEKVLGIEEGLWLVEVIVNL